MKTLFKYLSAGFLFCAALNANAQTFVCNLAFPRDIIAACPPRFTPGDHHIMAFSKLPPSDNGNP